MIGSVLGRLLRWSVRRAGETNLLLLALALLAVASTALGVSDRVRGVEPALALTLAALGLFSGWLVSLTSLSASWASLLSAILGLMVVLLRVGRLGGELLAISRAWSRLLLGMAEWTPGGPSPAWRPWWSALARLGEGASTLLARVETWGEALVAGTPTFDPAAVSVVWGFGLWSVSAWAGWLVCRRERPMAAITPSGVLLLTAFYHVWGSHILLLALLLAGFLLMALISYLRRMKRWHATNVDYPELRPQTIAVTLFLSLSLVTVAATVPSMSLDRVVDLVPLIRRERSEEAEAVAKSLGIERQGRVAFQEIDAPGLPRRHLLGAGPELSERVVMIVNREDGLPVVPEEAGGEDVPRYYWRSHTYDRYTGSGWATGETKVVAYDAGAPAITATLPSQRVVRQQVRWLGEGDPLAHTAGTLMVADQDYTVAWRSPEDPFAATVRTRSYRADSFVPVVSEPELREDRGSYPSWVRQRYLALPDDVPTRVLALARDLTATAATPYDRARAIEVYLRRFPYTLDVSTPPPDRDVVDYFLFDLEEGYCDYYASAMVVLARAAGLPARLAVGYATGAYDAVEGHYVVTEADAHAWPEIYFAAHGWVRFEPTAGRRPLDRAAGAGTAWKEPESPLKPLGRRWGGVTWTWWRILMTGAGFLGLIGMAWLFLDQWSLRRQEPTAVLASVYQRLRRLGRRLDVPMEVSDTPREFGVALASRVGAWSGDRFAWSHDGPQRMGQRSQAAGGDMGRGSWGLVGELVAAGAGEVIWLTDLYGRASYSPRPPSAAERAQTLRIWGRLRWRLRLAQLVRGLGLARVVVPASAVGKG